MITSTLVHDTFTVKEALQINTSLKSANFTQAISVYNSVGENLVLNSQPKAASDSLMEEYLSTNDF